MEIERYVNKQKYCIHYTRKEDDLWDNLSSIILYNKNNIIELDTNTIIDILFYLLEKDDKRANSEAWGIQSKMIKANKRRSVWLEQHTRTNAWLKNNKKKWVIRKQEWVRKSKSNKKIRA